MEGQMKIQNERIEFQDKRIDKQDRRIILLESHQSSEINIKKQKALINSSKNASSPSKSMRNFKEKTKRAIRQAPSNKSSVGSSRIKNKRSPRLCTSLYDPAYPDVVLPVKGKTVIN